MIQSSEKQEWLWPPGKLKKRQVFRYSFGRISVNSSDPSESYESSSGFWMFYTLNHLNCPFHVYHDRHSACSLWLISSLLPPVPWRQGLLETIITSFWMLSGALQENYEGITTCSKRWQPLTICHPKRANHVEQQQSDSWLALVK